MQINHDMTDILELLCRVYTGFDLEVTRVFNLKVLAKDLLVVDLESLVAQVGHFVGVARGADDYVGDLLQVGKDVHWVQRMMERRMRNDLFL